MRIEVEGKGAYEQRLTAPGDAKAIAWMKFMRAIIAGCGIPAVILILPTVAIYNATNRAFKMHADAYALRLEAMGVGLMILAMLLGAAALLAAALLRYESNKSAIRRGS